MRITTADPTSAPMRPINLLLVAANFACVYTELSAYSGGTLIFPNFGAFLCAGASVIYNFKLVKARHVSSLFFVVLGATVITLVGNVVRNDPVLNDIAALLQLITSIVTGYGIYLATSSLGRMQVVYLFGGFAVFITLGALLERFSYVKDLSDSIRGLLYDRELLYLSDRRDILQYGAIRPNFFSREPSLVGVHAGFALAVALIAVPNMKVTTKVFLATAATVVIAWIVRSPAMIFFVAIIPCAAFMLPIRGGRQPATERPVFAAAMAFILFVGPIAFFLGRDSRGVIGDFIYSGSFYLRLIGPPIAATAVVNDSPIFGLGVGGYDAALNTIRSTYAAQGVFARHSYLLAETDARYLMSNAFWEFPIFFGLAGLALMIFLFRRLLLSLGLQSSLFPFLSTALACQTLGGAAAYRLWFFFFTFAALAKLAQQDRPAPAQLADGAGRQSLPARKKM